MTEDITKPKVSRHVREIVLLFTVPLAVIALAAGIIYLPQLLANPKYDFIYSSCSDYGCGDTYAVGADSHITKTQIQSLPQYGPHTASNVYYYSVANDSSRAITFDEAQKYQLDASTKSPDGYSLEQDGGNGGFLFWGNYDRSWYLKNGIFKKKVGPASGNVYSPRSFTFLGWIKK